MPSPTPSPPAQPAQAGRWPRLSSRLQVRHRFAALGVVGVLMCALPLLQVLRYQANALEDTREAQAALDPLAHALGVQRGLVQHRDVAGAVLRGAGTREPERRRHQRVVNDRLTELELALRNHAVARATREGEALREDWTVLSRRVEERSLAAADSDVAHRLLVEQTLQVMDDVSLAALQLGSRAGPEAGPWMPLVLSGLPRLSARLGLLLSAAPGSAEAHPREFAAAQARLSQALAQLNDLVAAEGAPARAAASSGLQQAVAQFQQQADRYFQLQRSGATPEQLHTATGAVAEAEAAVAHASHAHLAQALDARAQALAWQRTGLLASLAVLLALGTVLGLSLLPPRPPGTRGRTRRPATRRFNAADPEPPDTAADGLMDTQPGIQNAASGPGGRETRHLLRQLRTAPQRRPAAAPDNGHPHTLPPED